MSHYMTAKEFFENVATPDKVYRICRKEDIIEPGTMDFVYITDAIEIPNDILLGVQSLDGVKMEGEHKFFVKLSETYIERYSEDDEATPGDDTDFSDEDDDDTDFEPYSD